MKNIDVEEEENVMVLPRSDNSVSTNEPLTPEVLSEPSKEEKVKTPEVSSEEKDEEKSPVKIINGLYTRQKEV